ncbi:unnamed protein product [Adineta steineri]|uniref:Signal peptidase complex subunit 1 n=1 Tax=Adineta steineri TaxID=433720 RepID=A0A814ATF8_9BILA|nr:unnamed protein product [Adineta steineri]CAF0916744.1 unnamed protein product [Adineta steineri]CAF0961098.1 unnamed protein product [Adineta steineri]
MIDIGWPFPTYIDYFGQKTAERLFQIVIILFSIIGFIAGYLMQQFSMTIYTLLFGVFVSALLTLPPWPMYRNNPIEWQKSSNLSKEIENNLTTKSSNKIFC